MASEARTVVRLDNLVVEGGSEAESVAEASDKAKYRTEKGLFCPKMWTVRRRTNWRGVASALTMPACSICFIMTFFVLQWKYLRHFSVVDETRLGNIDHPASRLEAERTTKPLGRRPLAVVHVGPHKTGTTDIQHFLTNHEEIIREKDRYWVPKDPGGPMGEKNTARLANCLNEDAAERRDKLLALCENGTETEIKTNFSKFVGKVASKNMDGNPINNILMSSEEFDRRKFNIDWLKFQLELSRFEVRIIMYYRRFHQWIASYYNQQVKSLSEFVNQDFLFLSIEDWLNQNLESYAESHTFNLYQRYSHHFQPSALKVLNFHNPSVLLLESFFCEALEGATNVCNLAQLKSEMSFNRSNPSIPLDWARILASLRARKFPDPNEDQRQTIQKHLRALRDLEEGPDSAKTTLWMAGDPPPNSTSVIWRNCPSQGMLDKVLGMSLSFEEGINGILPPIPNQTVLSSVEGDFHRRMPRDFCTINIDRLIDHWLKQNWFKSLWEN